MNTVPNRDYHYQVGGRLPPNHSAYIRREADKELLNSLKKGEFCYVLNSRQTGKSSLMARVINLLEAQQNIICVTIYMVDLIETNQTRTKWYKGIVEIIVEELNISIDVNQWWKKHEELDARDCLKEFIKNILLREITKQIVIFIDEIDSILRLDFPVDDFFFLLYEFYEKRSENPHYQNLNFAIFGVATSDELIQKGKCPLFETGKKIELRGFDETEISDLAKGISGQPAQATTIINEVLKWTQGQPFLTQKICSLIQELPEKIIGGEEKEKIKNLVQTKIIENWEKQDNPEHLQTIRDQIITRGKGTVRLLSLYQKILLDGKLEADNSLEQLELQISGLVVRENDILRVKNRIYEAVFNLNWVKQMIADLRPYENEFRAWSNNKENNSFLLSEDKLTTALKWALGKELTPEDHKFLQASIIEDNQRKTELIKSKNRKILDLENQIETAEITKQELETQLSQADNKTKWWKWKVSCFLSTSVLLIGLIAGFNKWFNPSQPLSSEVPKAENSGHILTSSYPDRQKGLQDLTAGEYSAAKIHFEDALRIEPDNPVNEILFNNASVREMGSLLKLAVIVPEDASKSDIDIQILRGIADAQSSYNQKQQLNENYSERRYLYIALEIDNDDPSNALEIAKKLTTLEEPSVLGVITYHLNDEAIDWYKQNNLTVICLHYEKCQSSETADKNVFPTFLHEQTVTDKLIEYISNKTEEEKLAIYSSKSEKEIESFKKKLQEEIENFNKNNILDLPKQSPDANQVIPLIGDKILREEITTIIFLSDYKPNSDINFATRIHRYKSEQLLEKYDLKFVGSYLMFESDVLLNKSQESPSLGLKVLLNNLDDTSVFEDLILITPRIDNRYNMKEAEGKWKEKVSWFTYASYLAVDDLVKAVKSINYVDLNSNNTEKDDIEEGQKEKVLDWMIKQKKNKNLMILPRICQVEKNETDDTQNEKNNTMYCKTIDD